MPCEKRIKDLQRYHEENADELEKDVEDGWVDTTNPEKLAEGNKDAGGAGVIDLDSDDEGKMQVISDANENKKKPEQVIDLDDSDDENMFAQPAVEEAKTGDGGVGGVSVKKVRKYDLSITYDFYT